jgi:hypothetical protein
MIEKLLSPYCFQPAVSGSASYTSSGVNCSSPTSMRDVLHQPRSRQTVRSLYDAVSNTQSKPSKPSLYESKCSENGLRIKNHSLRLLLKWEQFVGVLRESKVDSEMV